MTNGDELLTAPQAGALIGKGRRTVQRLAERGVLPIAHKVPGDNGAYLFRRADVIAYRDAQVDAAA